MQNYKIFGLLLALFFVDSYSMEFNKRERNEYEKDDEQIKKALKKLSSIKNWI